MTNTMITHDYASINIMCCGLLFGFVNDDDRIRLQLKPSKSAIKTADIITFSAILAFFSNWDIAAYFFRYEISSVTMK